MLVCCTSKEWNRWFRFWAISLSGRFLPDLVHDALKGGFFTAFYIFYASYFDKVPKMLDLAILWSHNRKKYPGWLDTIMRNCTGRFVWWDVAWPRPHVNPPLTGYIWNTVDGQATHRASVTRIEGQPSEQLTEEVKRSWSDCNIHVNPNSPLLLYQDKTIKRCSLLKLEGLKTLDHPGKLRAFILAEAKPTRPIKQPPQGYAKVIDPHLS